MRMLMIIMYVPDNVDFIVYEFDLLEARPTIMLQLQICDSNVIFDMLRMLPHPTINLPQIDSLIQQMKMIFLHVKLL